MRLDFCIMMLALCLIALQCTASGTSDPGEQSDPPSPPTDTASSEVVSNVNPGHGPNPGEGSQKEHDDGDNAGTDNSRGGTGKDAKGADGTGGIQSGNGHVPAVGGAEAGFTHSHTGSGVAQPPASGPRGAGSEQPSDRQLAAAGSSLEPGSGTGGDKLARGTGTGQSGGGTGKAASGNDPGPSSGSSVSSTGDGNHTGTGPGNTSGSGSTDTGSKITSTTTTKIVDDVNAQQNVNDTSTEAITPLIKPTLTEHQQPSVEKKNDGSSTTSLVLSLAGLVTFTAIAVVPV